MTTENQNPEEDNEIPPVSYFMGRAVSEWVVYSFIVITVIAVIFGVKVGGERDTEAERVMATLKALTEKAETQAASGVALVCDNSLLDADLLENGYLTLTVSQAPIDEDDESQGFGPSLYISVDKEEVSGDAWDTAKRVMNLVREAGKEEAEAKAKAEEDTARRDVADTVSMDAVDSAAAEQRADGEEEGDKKDKKPKNMLRKVTKPGFGDDEEFLRYHILASKTAVCSPDV